MRTVILSEEAYHDCCCTVAVQTISLPITHRLKPLVASLEPRWDRRFYAIAHTGVEPVISALRGRRPGPLDECAKFYLLVTL